MLSVDLFANNFNGGEWSEKLAGRFDLARYNDSCKVMLNCLPSVEGGMMVRPGTRQVYRMSELDGRNIPFTFSQTDSLTVTLVEGAVYFFDWDGPVMNGAVPYRVVTDYTIAQVRALKYVQRPDVLYLTCRSHRPMTLSRYGPLDWRFEEFEFIDGPYQEENTNYDLSVQPGEYHVNEDIVILSSDDYFRPEDVGTPFSIREQSGSTNYKPWASDEDISATARRRSGDNLYESKTIGKTGATPPSYKGTPTPSAANGPFSDGGVDWVVLNSFARGWVRIYQYHDPNQVSATVMRAITPSVVDDGTFRFRRALYNEVDGWPENVAFTGDRLVFSRDQHITMSRTGDYHVFTPEVLDDDAVHMVVAANQANTIGWLKEYRKLMFGTAASPWVLETSPEDSPISAKNLPRPLPQPSEGTSNLVPVDTPEALLYVTRGRVEVYSVNFNIEVQAFQGSNLNTFAAHVLQAGVKEIVWQSKPNKCAWCLLDDGTLASVTYSKANQVTAWARHRLGPDDAQVASICCRPSNVDETADEVYLLVRRNHGGAGVMYQELMTRTMDFNTTASNSVCLDGSVVFRASEGGMLPSVLTGLSDYEGETVTVWSNLGSHGSSRVYQGAVDLGEPVRYAVVGFDYPAYFESNPINMQIPQSNLVISPKTPTAMRLHVFRTGSCQVGTISDGPEGRQVDEPVSVGVYEYRVVDGDDFPLFSGIVTEAMESEWPHSLSYYVQRAPNNGGPFSVLFAALSVSGTRVKANG
jgi:hypothetical protein